MSDEHFLARWSRRKHEASLDHPAQPKPVETETNTGVAPHDEPRSPQRKEASSPTQSSPLPPTAVDLASLPSLDSITATTDVSGFLAPGVPAALTREALRRAWASDPAVRDFVGLQEYDGDFVTSGAIPGFGELGTEHNIKELVARVFGETPETPSDEIAEPAAGPSESVRQTARAVPPADQEDNPPDSMVVAERREEILQCNTDVAEQHDAPPAEGRQTFRRTHGGALPKT